MAVLRETIGSIPCLCCDQSIPIKKSTGGAVSVSCPWCDLSAYAKDGTMAHKKIMARLPVVKPEQDKKSAPDPIPVPVLVPVKKPAARNPLFPGA